MTTEQQRARLAAADQAAKDRAWFDRTRGPAATPAKVKVRCSDRQGRDSCGWSGERNATDPTGRRCPLCHCYTVEVVGRTNPSGGQEAAPMTTLDPAVADLLSVLVDLDERTWSSTPSERSVALAFASGALRAVIRGDAAPEHAAATIRIRLGEKAGQL